MTQSRSPERATYTAGVCRPCGAPVPSSTCFPGLRPGLDHVAPAGLVSSATSVVHLGTKSYALDRAIEALGIVEQVTMKSREGDIEAETWLSADVPWIECKWTANGTLKRGKFEGSMAVLNFHARR